MSETQEWFACAMAVINGAIWAAIFVNGRFKPKCQECETWWEQLKHHKRAIKQLRKYPINGER